MTHVMSRKTTTVTNCDYFNTMVLRDIDSKYNYRDLALDRRRWDLRLVERIDWAE